MALIFSDNYHFTGVARNTYIGIYSDFSTTSAFSGFAVPVPAAVWLFGSGLIGLLGVSRRKIIAV